MALLKKDKVKPVIRSASRSGVETSPLRPFLLPKLAPCMDSCPQGTEIRRVLMIIAQAQKYERPQQEAFAEAWRILTEKNPLPAVCGRVCPHPCEDACNRKDKDGALGINSVERFLGDWALAQGLDLAKTACAGRPAIQTGVIPRRSPLSVPARRDCPARTSWRDTGTR